MNYISHNYSFPRLRTLCLVLTRDDGQEEKPHYGDNIIAFFTSLEPLEELSISGPLEPKIIDIILCRHGRTLTKLVLRPVEAIPYGSTVRREMPLIFTKENILNIPAECLELEELVIPVKRMKSNKAEIEVYKSFAKMECLRSLFLILDCSDWRLYRDITYDPSLEPEFDDFDLQTWSNHIKNGRLRTALMNCAVDETLARSIWGLISQNKTGRQLESLRLWTTGAGTFGSRQNEGMSEFAENMSRSWLWERLPRDDKDAITVMEIGQFTREARDQEYRESRKSRLRFLKMRDYEASLTPEQREGEIAKYGELQQPPDSDSDYGLDEARAKIFSRI